MPDVGGARWVILEYSGETEQESKDLEKETDYPCKQAGNGSLLGQCGQYRGLTERRTDTEAAAWPHASIKGSEVTPNTPTTHLVDNVLPPVVL